MEKSDKPNYWVVGASFEGGTDHRDEEFVEKGIWMLGWGEGFQSDRAKQMNEGDRIAIKRIKGRGQEDIMIRHIGIIKGVVLETDKVLCTVDWVVTYLDKDVKSKGAYQSVHGPYKKEEEPEWIKEIFCL